MLIFAISFFAHQVHIREKENEPTNMERSLLFMSEQKKQNLADPSVRKRFVTYKEATELYSMGLTRIQEHAKVAGATYKMGNKVLFCALKGGTHS